MGGVVDAGTAYPSQSSMPSVRCTFEFMDVHAVLGVAVTLCISTVSHLVNLVKLVLGGRAFVLI